MLGIHKIKMTVKKIANGRFHSATNVFRISVKDAVLITSKKIKRILHLINIGNLTKIFLKKTDS